MFVASHSKNVRKAQLERTENQFDLPPYLIAAEARIARLRPPNDQASLPGDQRALEPPDPIPNSEVKRCIADGSVGYPHVRVGHRQALIPNPVVR